MLSFIVCVREFLKWWQRLKNKAFLTCSNVRVYHRFTFTFIAIITFQKGVLNLLKLSSMALYTENNHTKVTFRQTWWQQLRSYKKRFVGNRITLFAKRSWWRLRRLVVVDVNARLIRRRIQRNKSFMQHHRSRFNAALPSATRGRIWQMYLCVNINDNDSSSHSRPIAFMYMPANFGRFIYYMLAQFSRHVIDGYSNSNFFKHCWMIARNLFIELPLLSLVLSWRVPK